MRICLEDIPPEGLEVSFTLEGVDAGELGPAVEEMVSPLEAKLSLYRQDDLVVARGRWRLQARGTCSRCLEPLVMSLEEPLELAFRPEPEKLDDEIQLVRDDLDVLFYEGDSIDLGEAVIAEAGLALPLAPLCREDCPGVCPHCGKVHEGGECGPAEKTPDPRLAKLAQLKID